MPNQRARPTLRRRRLGEQLAAKRDEAGLSLEDAAAFMGWDKPTMSKIENARRHISTKEVEDLLGHYGVTDREFTGAMAALARDAGKKGWWAGFGDVGDSYQDLLSVDADAEAVRFFSPSLIPGLLQRGAYARQVINAAAITRTDEDKESLVRLRLARQSVLERSPNPLRLWAVVGEAALHQKFPDPNAMRDQLTHLLEMSNRSGIRVQVMPLDCGAHPGMVGMFSIGGGADGCGCGGTVGSCSAGEGAAGGSPGVAPDSTAGSSRGGTAAGDGAGCSARAGGSGGAGVGWAGEAGAGSGGL
ncbi:helix-turn-helix domain-containing protein, partial [[Kitasatospora] papulosa]|uniref:helix-turn-helix domain-containing protein n=1 Tax=[Kitasatospora] papulosa TaxID=1464011 RepID=UPI00367E8C3D